VTERKLFGGGGGIISRSSLERVAGKFREKGFIVNEAPQSDYEKPWQSQQSVYTAALLEHMIKQSKEKMKEIPNRSHSFASLSPKLPD